MAFSTTFLLLSLLLLPFFTQSLQASSTQTPINPFSPKASLLRQWKAKFPVTPMPEFLLLKASPLNTTQLATFSHYIDTHTLRYHILSFCTAGNLFCDLKDSRNQTHDVTGAANFESYGSKSFVRYQKSAESGIEDFKNYSVGENLARDTFLRYGQDSNGLIDLFRTYAENTNVASTGFRNYGAESNGLLTDFNSYGVSSNVQDHTFNNYDSDSNAGTQQFHSYSESSNVVENDFHTYGENANGLGSQFSGYSTGSNIITNGFKRYDVSGNAATGGFSGYSGNGNVALNDFRTYESDGNGLSEQFNNYGEGANVPENTFTSYGKGTHSPEEVFVNYGNGSNDPTQGFKEYGKDAGGENSARFTFYGSNATFTEYFKSETDFQEYANTSQEYANTSVGISRREKNSVKHAKFFRQGDLVAGKKIPMPDIRDKMPARSFLPRVLADKLPFSTTKLPKLVETLAASGLKAVMAKTISDCERPSVKDETKRCVTSIEGMTEFAASVLGKTAWVSTTANTNGSGSNLFVGTVVGRNNGKETRAVSCHQSLFPYLVYYCHMVPRVMVYDVELLDENSRKVANQGVAICHLDTTQWSAKHAAFLSLGGKPGKIEVCHWIFENDLIWVARD